MKNSFIILSLFLILPLISAVQINMNSNLSQGETLIAQVSGNFVNAIQQQNVLLYEGHVRVPFIPTIQEAGGQFYIYGQLLGKPAGNYSLDLTGLSYLQGGQLNKQDIIQNFMIDNNTADFSVDPGFVNTNNNFSINVESLTGNSITVTYSLENLTSLNSGSGLASTLFGNSISGQIVQINPGQTLPVSFAIENSDQDQLLYAVLQTNNTEYEIPVFIPSAQNQSISEIQMQPSGVNVPITVNSNTVGYVYVYNLGQNPTNFSLFESSNLLPYVSIPNETLIVQGNSSVQIQVNITSGNATGIIQGQISAQSLNSTSYMSLVLNVSNAYVPPSNNSFSPFYTCSQLQGELCSSNQTCSGQTQNAEDGVCCVGTCQNQSQGGSSGTIIGWIMVVIIIGLLTYFLIRKYRKAKRPLNLLDAAKNKPKL